METREQACIQEIHTLERHIDHLTHQLELANQALGEAKDEREALIHDIHSHRNMSYNLEMSSQDMQRHVAQLEQDKLALRQQAADWQRELDIAKRQTELERVRAAELERVIAQERRQRHDTQEDTSSLLRENDDLKAEIDRLKLRIQSLQTHIDSLQKYGNVGGAADLSNLSSINGNNSRAAQLEDQLLGA